MINPTKKIKQVHFDSYEYYGFTKAQFAALKFGGQINLEDVVYYPFRAIDDGIIEFC